MGGVCGSTGLLCCLTGKINTYTSHYLCIYEVAVQRGSRLSCYTDNISADAWWGISGQEEWWGRPGCPVGRLAASQTGPAILSLTQSCSCTQWKQLIPLFYREEGGGGLGPNNKALSVEMSAVMLGDCPTGQSHFHEKAKVQNECGK